jgi:hypothetical protein
MYVPLVLNRKGKTVVKLVGAMNFIAALKTYRGADKSLARPGRKQATATEDFDFHISYL